MSSSLDGLSNIYSLTSQINSLKDQATNAKSTDSQSNSIDPNTALLNLQKNFNDMLNELVTSSDDEEKKKESSDIFSSLLNNDTYSVNGQIYQTGTTSSGTGINVNSYTGSINNNSQADLLAAQYKLNLNLDKIF